MPPPPPPPIAAGAVPAPAALSLSSTAGGKSAARVRVRVRPHTRVRVRAKQGTRVCGRTRASTPQSRTRAGVGTSRWTLSRVGFALVGRGRRGDTWRVRRWSCEGSSGLRARCVETKMICSSCRPERQTGKTTKREQARHPAAPFNCKSTGPRCVAGPRAPPAPCLAGAPRQAAHVRTGPAPSARVCASGTLRSPARGSSGPARARGQAPGNGGAERRTLCRRASRRRGARKRAGRGERARGGAGECVL